MIDLFQLAAGVAAVAALWMVRRDTRPAPITPQRLRQIAVICDRDEVRA
jgi:hypothetical protein